MTDDSRTERIALRTAFPKSQLLLCVLHFLKRNWTWLHYGSNNIHIADRKVLIATIRGLVFAENESQLLDRYKSFTRSEIAKKYPKYTQYVTGHWSRRKEWAICFRKHLLVRGNHTNKYSESGIRILKELIFSRVKAYNLSKCFLCVYYTRKLLSAAHNRMDRYSYLAQISRYKMC